MTTRRQFLALAGAAVASPAVGGRALAQAYPSRPIRAMVPFTAGSTIDVVGRIVMDPLSAALGQPIQGFNVIHVGRNRGAGDELMDQGVKREGVVRAG